MHKTKQLPEDFVVKEISTIKPGDKGRFTYFVLKKKNYNTIDALKTLSQALRVPLKKFGFAGNKDKNAITEQTCSAQNVLPERLERLALKDITIKVLGKGDKPVSLGDLEANHFKITVRNIDELPEKKTRFLNLFGEQRFGKNNASIGKAIIKKDWKKAAELMSLEVEGNDYLGAIKKTPLKLLRLYVHAYQSLLWNKLAIKEKDKEKLPLVGFGTTPCEKLRALMEKEGITPRDFIIKEIPELSSEGTTRQVMAQAKNLEIGELEDDELSPGKKKTLLKFFLPPGSYATEFVKQLFAKN